jgi:hypothetical protein
MSLPPKPITAIADKYRVIARIGRGATADVNLAVASGPGGFNKLVVLKSLREELRGIEGYAALFMTEARLNAQLSHPHIVQTNEVFEFEGLPVIVMEYLAGQSLGAVVRAARAAGARAAFDQTMHLRVLSDVLHALDYAHAKRGLDGNPLSLVHCDVSPQNILLTYEGEVKLLDFGIARQISARGGPDVGVVRGKLRYMPPEQIAGEGIDHRTDLYAVGVMAWEAAAGVRLWANATDAELMRAVQAGQIPTPSSVTGGVDPELERIVMRALAPDKERRYPNALAMQTDLDAFLGLPGTQLRSRDIGAAVSELFADRRAQTEAIVADQLARLATCRKGRTRPSCWSICRGSRWPATSRPGPSPRHGGADGPCGGAPRSAPGSGRGHALGRGRQPRPARADATVPIRRGPDHRLPGRGHHRARWRGAQDQPPPPDLRPLLRAARDPRDRAGARGRPPPRHAGGDGRHRHCVEGAPARS